MEQSIPSLSVVMATYNRATTIPQTLQHLADQDLAPSEYEVIVIDDGSSDNTREVVESAKAWVPFKITYLHHANHGPGYTQNRGIEIARAPVVLLMADDIFMVRGALKAHLDTHKANPGREVAVLGRVEQPPGFGDSVFMRKWDPMGFKKFTGLTELPYYRFWACNISVKTDFVRQYGPFSEARGRFGPCTHEDPQLGYRLHKGGLRLLHNPDALGRHHHVVTLKQSYARSYERGMNFGGFWMLVPEPEIPVVYHVLNAGTLGDHFRAWFGPRRRYLMGADRSPVLTVGSTLLLRAVFNGLTVPFFWTPLLDLAERSPFAARFVNWQMYRGSMFYHFLRGCRDGDRKFGRVKLSGQLEAQLSK